MKYEQLIRELEDLARQIGIQPRYEKGDFEGGYCIVKDQRVLIINKRLHDMRKASVLAQALGEIGIESTFVKPTLRQYIEDEILKAQKVKSHQ